MSMTGSLVGYDNHNNSSADNKKLNRSLLNTTGSTTSKQCPSLNSSITNSVATTASSRTSKLGQCPDRRNGCARRSKQVLEKHRLHFNTLWSVWYGILVTLFQGYLVVQGAHRFLSKSFFCFWNSGWNEALFIVFNFQVVHLSHGKWNHQI